MLYRNSAASLTWSCLPIDLTLRSLNMFHGDLTPGHSLLMLFSWIGNLITLEQDQSTGILIVPVWTTQPWLTLLLNLLIDNPLAPSQTDSLLLLLRNSSSQQTVATNVLQSIRDSLLQRDISSKTTNIIRQPWSTGTPKQYALYIKKWHDFCSKWEVNPYNPPLNTVLVFLVSLHEQGLSYSHKHSKKCSVSYYSSYWQCQHREPPDRLPLYERHLQE